jgi:hypothetical protein
MTDRWVNAVITITVPLEGVSVDSERFAKQKAAGDLLERVVDALPADLEWVGSCHWEDASDDPEVEAVEVDHG